MALTATPGRTLPAPDRQHGPTVVHLLDLPPLGDEAPAAPRLFVAAAGRRPGWRRASLLVSGDDGASWQAIGGTAAPAIIGTAANSLPFAPETLADRVNMVEIALLHDDMLLEDADAVRLDAGANLALLGRELIQFGRATPLGAGRWRLSELLRGRRGTAHAASAHLAGERFVLIEADTLLAYDPPLALTGGRVRLLASGIGDPAPIEAEASAIGEALLPPPPVGLRADRLAEGGFDLRWIRSSRRGWRWLDGAEVPLGEDREAYLLTIRRADGRERAIELAAPVYRYDPADVAADRLAGPAVVLSVVQLGTHARSRPVERLLPL